MEYSTLSNICGMTSEQTGRKKYISRWSSIQGFLMAIAQPCSLMIKSCQFASKNLNCSKVFRTVITDEGICCSFNTMALEYMYKKYVYCFY